MGSSDVEIRILQLEFRLLGKCASRYIFTQTFFYKGDKTQGQFLSGVQII